MNKYTCAFRGRRDNYQVPLALAESGLLEVLLTDFYRVGWLRRVSGLLPARWREKAESRWHAELPGERVRCLWTSALLEQARHWLGYSPAATYAIHDRAISEHAARLARATESHLLLYEPYAWEAFRARYRHEPHRVLFQFHPHADTELRLLTEDVQRFPCVRASYEAETLKYRTSSSPRVKECWRHADLILCASSFTKASLLAAGADSSRCHAVPYGVEMPLGAVTSGPQSFETLFVGSGVQRKGLHHLLQAWRQARLPGESRLTLVCRHIDPGIRALLDGMRSVRLMPEVESHRLRELYATSSLFVMPSLVEGFGQVYLEALSYGCPVLGTAHTCLPDLGGEQDGVFVVEVGNVDQLAHKLEELAGVIPQSGELRGRSRAVAARRSWPRFRTEVVARLATALDR